MIPPIKFLELDRVYIPLYFKPFYSQTMLKYNFKVDTGADSFIMSKEDLYKLGYTYEWIFSNIAARGLVELANKTTVEVGVVQLPLMNILGYECKQWPFMVIMEEDMDFRNLLGRDLLAGFNYTFNNDKKEFAIEKTMYFCYTGGKRYEGQDIHEFKQLVPDY